MKQALISQYSISFENKILDFASGSVVCKIININNNSLGEFLTAWGNPQEINDLLIPDIEDVLNGVASLRENGSETISIDITPTSVIFYISNVGTNYPKIPTLDFKEIVVGWRDFLLQPPLNRTRI